MSQSVLGGTLFVREVGYVINEIVARSQLVKVVVESCQHVYQHPARWQSSLVFICFTKRDENRSIRECIVALEFGRRMLSDLGIGVFYLDHRVM